jgi:hypothetical protein
MNTANIKRKLLGCFAALLILAPLGFGAADGDNKSDAKADASAIIAKYLQTTQNHQDTAQSASMQVDIAASVPKLKEQGKLRALRKISKVGHITYRILGFQGDNTIKTQVIARYLQAEQQGQGNDTLGITPTNYKFKYRGEWQFEGREAYLFALSPRKKRVGLFKGELWLDAGTYLPVYEKGRFVKNPSVFFKRVVFQRGFSIENGRAIPRYMTSTIDTRVIGKVELTISYSNFVPNPSPDAEEAESAARPTVAKVAK